MEELFDPRSEEERLRRSHQSLKAVRNWCWLLAAIVFVVGTTLFIWYLSDVDLNGESNSLYGWMIVLWGSPIVTAAGVLALGGLLAHVALLALVPAGMPPAMEQMPPPAPSASPE